MKLGVPFEILSALNSSAPFPNLKGPFLLVSVVAMAAAAMVFYMAFRNRKSVDSGTAQKESPKSPNDWISIMAPADQFEGDIIIGRLRTAGIEAKFASSDVGDYHINTQNFIKVHQRDLNGAKELLGLA